jgi:hypothetical protein
MHLFRSDPGQPSNVSHPLTARMDFEQRATRPTVLPVAALRPLLPQRPDLLGQPVIHRLSLAHCG